MVGTRDGNEMPRQMPLGPLRVELAAVTHERRQFG